jgi:hypothetical protein
LEIAQTVDMAEQRDAIGLHGHNHRVMIRGREPQRVSPLHGMVGKFIYNNKIKRLKRLMYGRGGFDLLRKRILHTNAAS